MLQTSPTPGQNLDVQGPTTNVENSRNQGYYS